MRSAASEIEERHDVALVGATQRAQIRLPYGTSISGSGTSAPRECLLPESHDERLSSETSKLSVLAFNSRSERKALAYDTT